MLEFKEFANGFHYIEVMNDAACAEVALQGAHVFHYALCDEDEPILWLSDESKFEEGVAIRGGIPICWPSFGSNNPKLPQHGFARVLPWEFISSEELDAQTTQVVLELKDSDESRKYWEYKFTLQLKITVSNELTIELTTVNMDEKPFVITQALHSYFQVSDISNIEILGLEEKPFLDALTGLTHVQNGVVVFEREVDRVYQEVQDSITLKDQKRSIQITAKGSNSCVVWNPWIEKCKRMSAMSDEAYKEFVCIESANAYEDFKSLETGESHTLQVVIS